jgi:hypothetical protein
MPKGAIPSLATLGEELRCTTRAVQYALTELKKCGAVHVVAHSGASNEYLLISDDPRTVVHGGVNGGSPPPTNGGSPYIDRSEKDRENIAPRRDLLFEALCQVCDVDWHEFTQPERKKFNDALAKLKAVHATPAEVKIRASEWPRRYERIPLTPHALVNNWAALAPKRAVRRAEPTGPRKFYDPEGNEIATPTE